MNTDTIRRNVDDATLQKVNELMPLDPAGGETSLAHLKIKINTLLWEELPGSMTLEEAEKLACVITEKIIEAKPATRMQ